MASLVTAPLSSLWNELARVATAAAQAMPDGLALAVCFIGVFGIVFLGVRRATAAGERRALHDVACVRLGISDEYALPLRRERPAVARRARRRLV